MPFDIRSDLTDSRNLDGKGFREIAAGTGFQEFELEPIPGNGTASDSRNRGGDDTEEVGGEGGSG